MQVARVFRASHIDDSVVRPVVAGTEIKVAQIASEHEHLGMTPDEIVEAHPHLTLADVHAALSYYFDHLDAIRADWREGQRIVAEMEKVFPRGVRPRRAREARQERRALRLHADECVDGRIVAGLRRRGIDVVTSAEEGLRSATDPQHMTRVCAVERVLLTADQDILRVVAACQARGVRCPGGVFFILCGTPVGEATRAVADAAEVIEPSDMTDWVEWMP